MRYIFAIGGYDGTKRWNNVQKYIEYNDIDNMNNDNKNSSIPMHSNEYKSNQWNPCQSMLENRSGASSCSYFDTNCKFNVEPREYIIVIGGYNGNHFIYLIFNLII